MEGHKHRDLSRPPGQVQHREMNKRASSTHFLTMELIRCFLSFSVSSSRFLTWILRTSFCCSSSDARFSISSSFSLRVIRDRRDARLFLTRMSVYRGGGSSNFCSFEQGPLAWDGPGSLTGLSGRFTDTVVVVVVAADGSGDTWGSDWSCQLVWFAGLGLLLQLLEEVAETVPLLVLEMLWLGCDGRV